MMKRFPSTTTFFASIASIGLLASCVTAAHADVSLPLLFTDGMVLQQKRPVRIYGKAGGGEKVMVAIQGQAAVTVSDAKGDWQVWLKPLKAGGPFTLTVQGNNTVTVKDVLVGEVWVCSGQSNMEWNMAWLQTPEAAADIVASADSQLRMFTVTKSIAAEPQSEVANGKWAVANAQNTGTFSAVGYYFARSLRKSLNVPVGMIHTSWGGTRIEAWTSKEVLLKNGISPNEFTPTNPQSPAFQAAKAKYEASLARWKATGSPEGAFNDPGIAANAKGWESADLNDSDWGRATLPGLWEQSGIAELDNVDGAVWYRRTFEIPAIEAGKEAVLTLGAIDDWDTTYINGVKVGATGAETPNYYQHPRKYEVPANVLKPGKNVIAVRVWDHQGGGGFSGPIEGMRIAILAGSRLVLAGEWRYKIEVSRPQNPGRPPNAQNPNAAAGLYNAMLFPISRYTVQGAIWYQGESNAGNPMAYRKQMPAMIQNWRDLWGSPDMPFYMVQLAPFTAIKDTPSESGWAGLREAQSLTAQNMKNVGVAVITDVGDVKDIHPRRKAPVGERLALLARKQVYGEKIAAESPTFESMKTENGQVTVTFRTVGAGLVARSVDSAGRTVPDNKVLGFAIAGPDGKFVWADATISGKNTITLRADGVPNPTMVRFGWADYPVVNLFSAEGLPVSPFRTDAPK
jgi:sialate O-acetylesterase